MKSSRVLNVQTRDIRGNLNKVYDLYSSRVAKIERDYIVSSYRRRRTRNVSCQCNIRRNLTCTCRKLAYPETRYFTAPKQVYRYSDWRNYTDIGVGSIKPLPRKRLRKVYLPETVDQAVGSVDLTSYANRRRKPRSEDSCYDSKQTLSKCVGGLIGTDNVPHISKKLSPIIQKRSGTTSPRCGAIREPNKNIGSYVVHEHKSSIAIQANMNHLNTKPHPTEGNATSKIKSNRTSQQTTLQSDVSQNIVPTVADNLKSVVMNNKTEICKDYSSDSFVQHVHIVEHPTDEKPSKMSVDPMENKLEREYRKIVTSKSKDKTSVDKTIPDFRSTSVLRRRFEAMRRGICKKEPKKENVLLDNTLSPISAASRKDVSILSDQLYLEGQSYLNTKIYSRYQTTTNDYKPKTKISPTKSPKGKNYKDNTQLSADSKCESVQGMLKLWREKNYLDENNCKTSPKISNDKTTKSEQISKSEPPPRVDIGKKQGKKFFFFGKKNKEKDSKHTAHKPKKGVKTGRSEVKDGLTIKVGGNNEYPLKEPVKNTEKPQKYEEKLRKAWLDKYITNTRDSRNSVHIRWNNKMYATSSSTVLELMDSVYKHTGIDFRSRSEITTGESSNYHSYTKQRVHFMHQNIETWIVPKMITEWEKQSTDKIHYKCNKYSKNNPIKISNHRWFVDAANGFTQKFEVVLHSKSESESSEYVIINIPEGYFFKSSSETRAQSSDEKIYNIVEYETPDIKKEKENRQMATCYNKNNMKVTVGVQNDENKDKESKISDTAIKNPPLLRDVAIQGSNVCVPKRCDVIGVGIITHRDIRDVTKPVVTVEDDLTEDESLENIVIQKKCELAESYLQDYCRNSWMTSGIDTLSWRLRDSRLQSSENTSSISQGDGAKSCPNMYAGFQESTIVLSSCKTSSCSHCIALEEVKKQEDSLKSKLFSKFRKKSSSEAPMYSEKRNVPKDSLEVFKKRQFYACTNQKCKWFNEKHSMSSNEGKETCPKSNIPCWRLPEATKNKKKHNKRVSLPGCEDMSKLVAKLSDRSLEGILSYKGSGCNQKVSHTPKILSKPVCEISQTPCKEGCVKEKRFPCTKKNAPPCDELLQERFDPETMPPCKKKPSPPVRDPPLCTKPVIKPTCSACYNPPCRDVSTKQSNHEIRKNQSQESGVSLKISPRPSPKNSDSCLNTNPKITAHKLKKDKPNCANKKFSKNNRGTPPTPPPTAYHMPRSRTDVCSDGSKEKKTGLHLKKLPSKKKTSCDDGYGSRNIQGVNRLNSNESIRMKKETPSTEDVRECVNIKVQDEDGQTLYERIDYKQSAKKCLLKDMYNDPQIQRISTPTNVQDVMAPQISQNQSDSSIDHLIEINFTLKLKKGDRGTEVNIKNVGDTEIKQKEENAIESQRDMYILQKQNEHEPVIENKKDVNIKIVIKNYTSDPDKNNETETYHDNNTGNFTQRISEKFQTVSSGYGDLVDHHAFSIHRATEDLTSSADRCILQSESTACNQLVKTPKNLIASSQRATEHTVYNEAENSTQSNKKNCTHNASNTTEMSYEETDKRNNKSHKHSVEYCNQHTIDTVDETSNDIALNQKARSYNKTQKKAILKKLSRSSSAVKKPDNKRPEDIAVPSNELAKELTYASLDQSYFRDTDSMNNYYEFDSEIADDMASVDKKVNPTKDNSEFSEIDSDVSSVAEKNQGCLCSTLATKLNITMPKCGCCCQTDEKDDKKIEVINDNFLNLKQNSIDDETQCSNHVSSKINSANFTVRSKTQSVLITNASVTVQKNIRHNDYPPAKCNCAKTFFPDLNEMKYCGIKRFDRETILGLADDETLVLNSKLVQKSVSKCLKRKTSKHNNDKVTADILQLNETKKAVLAIYAEKVVSDEGERFVVKLPKFRSEKENDISNYESIVTGSKKVSKRNFIMTTVNR